MYTQPEPSQNSSDNVGNADAMIDYEDKNHELPVALTDRERLELGQDMAAAMAGAEQAEKDKKAAVDAFNGTIEAAYADVSQAANTLRYGKTVKPVNCQHRLDYRLGEIRVVRMDDGTEIERRTMTKAERQMGMHFDDETK